MRSQTAFESQPDLVAEAPMWGPGFEGWDASQSISANIARRYGIHGLLPEALRELAERDAPLGHAEHELLGSRLAADVMRYREARWRSDDNPEYVPCCVVFRRRCVE